MLCGRIHSVHSPTTLSLYHIFPEKSSPCREIPFFFVNSLLQFIYLPQYAPFSAVERGEGSPRWRFCCFRYQLRWDSWENDNNNIAKQHTEYEYIHILKVLGGLGAEVCRMANFMHWQRQCCSSQEAPRRSPVPHLNCNKSVAHAMRSSTEKESPSPGGGGPAAGDPQIPDRLCMPAGRQPSYHRAKRMPAYRRNRQTGPFPPLWFSGDRRSQCMSIRAISDIRPLPIHYTTKSSRRQDSAVKKSVSAGKTLTRPETGDIME